MLPWQHDPWHDKCRYFFWFHYSLALNEPEYPEVLPLHFHLQDTMKTFFRSHWSINSIAIADEIIDFVQDGNISLKKRFQIWMNFHFRKKYVDLFDIHQKMSHS